MMNLQQANVTEFTRSIVPIFNGPQVTIRVKSGNREYTVAKGVLCQSPYFSKMFEGNFSEGQSQVAILEDVEGVVNFDPKDALDPGRQISAIIEFVRLADMCAVTGMESQITQRLEAILLANAPPVPWSKDYSGVPVDAYTQALSTDHIFSVECLPQGHPVRRVLAKNSVPGFLRSRKHNLPP
ncbi:hypothetical protein PEBR_36593 [Penicillium brasilianum]|uniref:BTB domain-containing protein n=1 Tax=Penicillium brasilianum TaxID=104259 RepID=A0A1S9RC73_PENBI|nr:hypothetical protein PEBR_36593 [Penicillium brasilianum]